MAGCVCGGTDPSCTCHKAPLIRNVASVECEIAPSLTGRGLMTVRQLGSPHDPDAIRHALARAGFRPGDRCTLIWRAPADEPALPAPSDAYPEERDK